MNLKIFTKFRFYSFLKIFIIVIVFTLYCVILLKASMASMDAIEGGKLKTNNKVEMTTYNGNAKSHTNHSHKSAKSSRKTTTTKKPPITSTINPIYEYSEELNAAAETEFNQRRDKLWETCTEKNIIGKYAPNAWEFFISSGHGITWCNVFKAASSTWMYYFNILGGYNIKFLQRTKTSPLELARNRFPRPTFSELSEALTNSISFLTVREPFERLLSAYRNKLEGSRNKYYKLLGKQIVEKFRNKTEKRKKVILLKTNYVFWHLIRNHQLVIFCLNFQHSSGPTFKEFLLFLINHKNTGGHFDEHWTPIYTFCTPCSINFTLIAKVETFQRDTEYIIRQAGLETLLLNKLPQNKVKSISNRSTSNTKKLIPKYDK